MPGRKVIPLAFTILLYALPASAQQTANRDEFYWLGQINKALRSSIPKRAC
jgi:argininosuccinate lyase